MLVVPATATGFVYFKFLAKYVKESGLHIFPDFILTVCHCPVQQ